MRVEYIGIRDRSKWWTHSDYKKWSSDEWKRKAEEFAARKSAEEFTGWLHKKYCGLGSYEWERMTTSEITGAGQDIGSLNSETERSEEEDQIASSHPKPAKVKTESASKPRCFYGRGPRSDASNLKSDTEQQKNTANVEFQAPKPAKNKGTTASSVHSFFAGRPQSSPCIRGPTDDDAYPAKYTMLRPYEVDAAPQDKQGNYLFSYKLFRSPANEHVRLVCTSASSYVAEFWARKLDGSKVLGLDTEWKPFGGKSAKEMVSLIQLASEELIVLFHIARFKGDDPAKLLPPTLRKILESSEVLKAGSSIRQDAARMREYLKCDVQGGGGPQGVHVHGASQGEEAECHAGHHDTALL